MSDTADPETGPIREIVTFRLSGQDFCIGISSIREIRGWTQPTPLPHSPTYLKGLINLRGTVLPIMDLAERLGLPCRAGTERDVIIVATVGSQLIGLVVDSVSDILVVEESSIQPTPSLGSDNTQESVCGILSIEERMIRILDLDHIFGEMHGEAA